MFTVIPQGLAFLQQAPVRVEVSVELPKTSALQIFAALTDAEMIPQWWTACRSVRWTTPAPHQVGSERILQTRTLTTHQRVIAWQPGHRFAVTVTQAGLLLYRSYVTLVTFEPFDRHGTRVRWTTAIDEAALIGPARPFLHRIARHNANAALRGLTTYLELPGSRVG